MVFTHLVCAICMSFATGEHTDFWSSAHTARRLELPGLQPWSYCTWQLSWLVALFAADGRCVDASDESVRATTGGANGLNSCSDIMSQRGIFETCGKDLGETVAVYIAPGLRGVRVRDICCASCEAEGMPAPLC